ncbi:MAG: 3-deoxy-D-manno-octulosonic acid transferase [Kiritimatiellae bacterium]|nr:3-deoxy-D-manno-octulosonic acid transferase [Kiritimatiellia bacterium]
MYNALFAVAYAVMVPSFLLRMKRRGGYRARFSDRFGRYPSEIAASLSALDSPIWIHAVSVGEVQVAGQLMRAMRERNPNVRFVFSTTSSTGWKTAEREVTPDDVLIYNPLDFGGCVKRALDAVNPRAVILTETEIWPNFIRALKKRGVPICLVNARISDRSAPRYKALRWFFGEVFRCFTKIYAQSDLDAQRLTDAGADPATVQVTGSFKFDVAHRNEAKERELRAWIGEGEILLGGSTWPGEDVVMLNAYKRILEKHPGVKLVIAPRHFEKADAVEANIRAAGFECVRRSRSGESAASPSAACVRSGESAASPSVACAQSGESAASPRDVYLCDTTGELMGLFGISVVAFVGKSLCEHGSQNMIEPCLCGVATVVGPYTENFRPVMSDLLAADALVQTPDADTPEARAASVEAELLRFFDEPERRAAYGQRAQAAVARRCGVVGRCADELLGQMENVKCKV